MNRSNRSYIIYIIVIIPIKHIGIINSSITARFLVCQEFFILMLCHYDVGQGRNGG